MSNPYASVPIRNYNLLAPPDGGEQTANNEITWRVHKQKVGDPLKSAIDLIIENILNAMNRVSGGTVTVADNYTVLAGDQGKTIRVTSDNTTVTLIAASTVGAKFRFSIVNMSTTDLTIVPAGGDTIDDASSLVLRPRGGVDLDCDGGDWFSSGQNYEDNARRLALTVRAPEGYLTLTSGAPVITADVASATAVYYTPDNGACVPISDGLQLRMREISELTLSLSSNHVANAIYDVFLFEDENKVIRIGTGPAWNTATAGAGARGSGAGSTELERFKGFLVNRFEISARNGSTIYTVGARRAIYIGSIFMDTTNGRVTCHRSFGQNRKWGVWNYYNRKPIRLRVGDATSSWSYAAAAWRQSRAQTGNKGTVFCGVADEAFRASFFQGFRKDGLGGFFSGSFDFLIGIGLNSTTTPSGEQGFSRMFVTDAVEGEQIEARYEGQPLTGVNNLMCLEQTSSGGGMDFIFGTETLMQMLIEWRG